MKKGLLFLAATFSILSVVFAQQTQPTEQPKEVQLKSAEISWGDSAFTSGLTASLFFTLKNSSTLELVGNSEQFYAVYDMKLIKDKLFIGPSGGVFKKLPWVGPRVDYFPIKQVMLMYWAGYSPGRIGNLKSDVKSFYQEYGVYATPEKHLSIGYTLIKFDTNKTDHLPTVAYSYWLKDNLRLKLSYTHDVTAKKPLFCLYLMYAPPPKK